MNDILQYSFWIGNDPSTFWNFSENSVLASLELSQIKSKIYRVNLDNFPHRCAYYFVKFCCDALLFSPLPLTPKIFTESIMSTDK